MIARIVEDGSRYWGWEIDLAHPDSTGMILLQFMENLRNADERQAKLILSALAAKNRRESSFTRVLHSRQRSKPERRPQFLDRELRFTTFSTSRIPTSVSTGMAYIHRCAGHSCRRAQRDSAFTHGAVCHFSRPIRDSTSRARSRSHLLRARRHHSQLPRRFSR